jgi:hypothetical protein
MKVSYTLTHFSAKRYYYFISRQQYEFQIFAMLTRKKDVILHYISVDMNEIDYLLCV